MTMTVSRLNLNHSDYEREHDGRTMVYEQVPVCEVDSLCLLQNFPSPVESKWMKLSTDSWATKNLDEQSTVSIGWFVWFNVRQHTITAI
jgi:hypothetical protein